MVAATNYSINPAPGTTNISGGKSLPVGDLGILLCGDSNLCGAGGGVNPSLDATVNQLYQMAKTSPDTDQIIAVDPSTTPHFDHSLNDGPNEVGPALKFCDRFATERAGTKRVVGLPAGDAGSGFSTSQWFTGEPMKELAKDLVNKFLAKNQLNQLSAIIIQLGTNDVGDFSPQTTLRDHLDAMIDDFHGSYFTGNLTQTSFATVPIIVVGLPPDWYTGFPERQEVHDFMVDTPNRKNYTGYATTDTLSSEAGDAIHLSGASNRTLGDPNCWNALVAAEANTP